MNQKPNCAVLIPIYKSELDGDELLSVKTSLSNLQGHDIYWVAPEGLDLSYYNRNFGVITPYFFDPEYFKNIAGYNKLLTSTFFYETFIKYEFCLICQPDAIVLKPELNEWLEKPYDYIGAPWPNGYSLKINTNQIQVSEGVTCTAFVGNGGLSLRRNIACIELLQEFPEISATWRHLGHAEDLFFSLLGTISMKFNIPNIMIAANFSHDIDPIHVQNLINGKIPFGIHAWQKYEKESGYLKITGLNNYSIENRNEPENISSFS